MSQLYLQYYKFTPAVHNGKRVIWVTFERNQQLIDDLKANAKAYWSQSNKCWYVTDKSYNRKLFGLEERVIGKDALSKIHPVNLPAIKNMKDELTLRGYSLNTKRTYLTEVAQLLYLLNDTCIDTLSTERLRSYFLYCHETLHLSENEIHSRLNAIKFYFEKVLKQDKIFIEIPRPKKKLLLPKALNKEEIKRLFKVVDNLKHKMILQLCYGMGLRVSEIVRIKLKDIDTVDMVVRIENSKGKKDRIVPLPKSILEKLRAYAKEYRPKEYLFEGQDGGQYAIRSAQAIFKNAMNKAGIYKTVGIHGLRHSYATHLMEHGTNIAYIQELLGHNDLKTTMKYTHIANNNIANTPSPLDFLK